MFQLAATRRRLDGDMAADVAAKAVSTRSHAKAAGGDHFIDCYWGGVSTRSHAKAAGA